MATDVGTVYVEVVPDGSNWVRRVNQIVKNTPNIKIGLDVDTRRVVEKVNAALDQTFEIAVNVKFSAEQIARELYDKTRGLSVQVNASISHQSLGVLFSALQGIARGAGQAIGGALAAKLLPDLTDKSRTVHITVDVDSAKARIELLRLTHDRKIEIKTDVDKGGGAFSAVTGAFSAITETGAAAAKTVSAVAGGIGAAAGAAEGAVSIFQGIANAFKGLVSLGASAGKSLGSFAEGAAAVGATVAEIVASGGLVLVLAAVVVAAIAATAAISSFAIALLAAAAAEAIFAAAAVIAGAAATVLATAVGVLATGLGLLPGVIAAATGGLAVLALAFAPVMKAFTAFMSLQDAQAKQGPAVAKAQEAAARATNAASKNLARARKTEADAEKGVSKARDDARNHLEQLTQAQLAATRAADAANRGVLGAASKAAQVMGDATASAQDRLDATLALQDAEGRAADASASKTKADKDLNEAQRKGINGSDEVIAAQKQLADAHQATMDAQIALTQAQKDGAQSIRDAAASTQDYDVAMQKLSAQGLVLLGVLKGLFAIMDPISKAFQEVTFPGITAAVKAFGELFGTMKNGKFIEGPLLEPLKLVGAAISEVAGQFAVLFKDPKFVKDLGSLLTTGAAAITAIGGPLVDLIKSVVSGLSNLGSTSDVIWTALGDGIKLIGEALKIFFDAMADPAVAQATADALTALMGIISDVLTLLGPFIAELAKLAGPFLKKLQGPLVELFGAFLDIILQFMSGGVLDGFIVFLQSLGDAFQSLVDSGVITQISKALGDMLTTLGAAPAGGGDSPIAALFKAVSDALLAIIPLLPDLVKMLPGIVDSFVQLVEMIVPNIPSIIELVNQFTKLALDVLPVLLKLLPPFLRFLNGVVYQIGLIVGVVDSVVKRFNELIGFFEGLGKDIAKAASGMWDGLYSTFKGIVNLIIRAWNAIDFGIHITVPNWVPGIGGKGFNVDDVIPDIPYLAKGGIVTGPTALLAGEAGPEAIIPLNQFMNFAGALGASLGNFTTERAAANNNNTKNVNLNVYGGVHDEADVDMIMSKLSFASLSM